MHRRESSLSTGILLVMAALIAGWGCGKGQGVQPMIQAPVANGDGKKTEDPGPEPVENPGTNPVTAPDGDPAVTKVPPTPVEPEKPGIPNVVLSEEHANTCLVNVGDPIPEIKLADSEGTDRVLTDLLGTKATVVLFWSSKNVYAQTALEDLAKDVASPFGEKGINVVAINKGDSAEDAKAVIAAAKVTYPQLFDPQGTAFAKVATQKTTRVYLLDPAGKILWFEIGYDSAHTRRVLLKAIEFLMSEEKKPE